MATLIKIPRKEALEQAQQAKSITVSDSSFGWRDKPISYAEMIDIINEYGKVWNATRYEGSNIDNHLFIDTRGRIHFDITIEE